MKQKEESYCEHGIIAFAFLACAVDERPIQVKNDGVLGGGGQLLGQEIPAGAI